MSKIIGLGGIFFKCKDPKQMNEWYAKNLGMQTSGYGATFEWLQADKPEKKGSSTWSPFPQNTKYFDPSTKDFMINYLVEDIEGLVEQLKAGGVTIVDEITASDYGKFVHIIDPEGNAVELWEPNDE